MKQFLLTSLLFLTAQFILKSQPVYLNYDWEDVAFPSDTFTGGMNNIKNTDIIQFIEEQGYFTEYRLKHLIELIRSDEQIQLNNRKYLPLNQNSELVLAKIRLIKPDGSELMLDESKILTAQDENTGAYYRYFAIEGLEPGSIIDYYYVIRKYPEYNGNRVFIQDEFPTGEYNFELYCPTHLEFSFKVYNMNGNVTRDPNATRYNHWTYSQKNVPALKSEESAPMGALMAQLAYKIDNNISVNSYDMTSFGAISQATYSRVSPKLSSKDQKETEKFLSDAEIPAGAETGQVISMIEDHVKDNINLVPNNDEKYSEIASVINSKSANVNGMVRLLYALYKLAGVECQIVLTSDRTSYLFDADFESYHYLTDYLFYFPATGGFISPDLFEYRYGIIPYDFTGNYGLFIREQTLGDYTTGIGVVNFIPYQDYETSYHNTEANVRIADDFESVELELKNTNMGEYANYMQPYYDMINEETKTSFHQDDCKQYFSDGELTDLQVENAGADYVGKKPFINLYKATVRDLVDRAGNSYLLKAGKLIGPQIELYSEDKRNLPWDDGFKRQFNRTLTIEIPQGYSLKNPEDLNIYADYVKEGRPVLMFKSLYRLEGQKLIVDIQEYYDQVVYTPEEYESYRKVVNSAADFEKVVLVFEKEN